jgi:mRNA interferase HigB
VGEIYAVHVISRKKLKEAAATHADLESPLDTWFRAAKRAQWRSLADVRKTYPHADAVEGYTVFNIKGNAYRLIVTINYQTGRIFIRHVLTHEEYTRGRWKS